MCDRQSTQQKIGKVYHDRYQIKAMIGKGGMGKVFLAKDIKTGQRVAIKIVEDQNRWERERAVLERLDHTKGIPKLYFAGNEGEFFLAMEYISGDSLKQYSRYCGKRKEKENLMWMIKLSKVLESIHQKGIIHMDIKPENIILHSSGRVYLIDFGVSLFEGENLSGYGTKKYASKRQAQTNEKANAMFDIYSFGKTMEAILKPTNASKKIIRKCLLEDKETGYDSIRQIRIELKKIRYARLIGKYIVVCLIISCAWSLKNKVEKDELKKEQIIAKEDTQEEIKKAMAYFYGNDHMTKDMEVSRQYFEKLKDKKKNSGAYLILIDVLTGNKNDLSKEEIMECLKKCQMDVYDFWSAYFYLDVYVSYSSNLSDEEVKEAEKMEKLIGRYPQNNTQKRMVEADLINLYEIMAEKGDDKKFLDETKRMLDKDYDGKDAWEIYERRIIYLDQKKADVSEEFEKFIKKYPKVMESYIEYGIYLCRKNKIEKARRIYLDGKKETGMTSKRANGLRRKLGL